MNKNTVIIAIVSVVAIFGFLGGAYMLTNKPPQQTEAPTIESLKNVKTDDHVKWSPAKKHVLVEYSDLQCPACKMFHDYISKNVDTDKKITDNITFVYRHFPLTQIHKNSYRASLAAEAAGNQKKFFEMADNMFNTQAEWETLGNPDDYFISLAKKLNLNIDQFKKDMQSGEVASRVKRDMDEGNGYNVDSTPTFYIDGKKIENISTYEEFKQKLVSSIK